VVQSLYLDSAGSRGGAPPVTDALIEAAEASLGVVLPAKYKELLKERNGGYLRLTAHRASPNTWSHNHVPIEFLPGIWGTSDSYDVQELCAMQKDTQFGDQHKLIALCGDGHAYICLDYTSRQKGEEPAVVYWQQEKQAEKPMVVATDFASFVKGLIDPESIVDQVAPAPVDEHYTTSFLLGPLIGDDEDDEDEGSYHDDGAQDEDFDSKEGLEDEDDNDGDFQAPTTTNKRERDNNNNNDIDDDDEIDSDDEL